MNISMAARLADRLEQNMAEFKSTVLRLDTENVYKMAREIAAVDDAFYQLSTQVDFDDSEAEFFLRFKNPLMILAEMWAEHLDDQSVDFDGLMYDFFDDENLGKYPLMSDAGDDEDESEPLDEIDAALLAIVGAILETAESIVGYVQARYGYSFDEDDEDDED